MNARKFMVGLVAAALLAASCGGKGNVPDPKEPEEPYVDPMLAGDPPENRSLAGLAGLIISSSPDGIDVLVDGVKKGKTPITVEKLDEGTHEVTFAEPDDPVTLTVELGEGEFKKVHHSVSPDSSDARMGK
jgi:hypothetical protein